MSNLNLQELYKHRLMKSSKRFENENCDVIISTTSATAKVKSINVKYINPTFAFYKFVSFIPYNGILYFELSNGNSDINAYAISSKNERDMHTKVSGANYEILSQYVGKYNIVIMNKSVKDKTMLCYLKEEVQI